MEFGWTEEDQAYRDELRVFLRARLPSRLWESPHHIRVKDRDAAKEVIAFNQALADRGWLTPHWPAAYGGRDASAWQHVVLGEELWSIGEPRGPQYMNVNWIGPAVMAAGTDDQKRYHLGRIAAGDVFWCQGFSEPDAGSDLASLRTSAVRDGDEYVVNGQKIWTSHCQVADFCFLLVRTAPGGHMGITILLVPMDTPGLEVQSVTGFIGEGAFHELTFTDMRVPVSCRLGGENEGWDIVRKALKDERVGAPRWERASLLLDAVAREARARRLQGEPATARLLGEAKAMVEAARLLAYAVVDERAKGKQQRPTAYVARVAMVRAERAVARLAVDVMGADGLELDSLADDMYRTTLTASVAAGTYEIQLNLIAGQVLGLPRS